MAETMRSLLLGLGACILAVIAACTQSSGAHPASSSVALAPHISQDELSVARYVGKPCDLLGDEQLHNLGVTGPGVVEGSACQWTPEGAVWPPFHASVDVTSGGLEQLYRHRTTSSVFEPTQISGYPAVNTAENSTKRRQGQCTTQIGVAQTALLLVSVNRADLTSSAEDRDPCHDVDLIAMSVMATLKKSSP
ncbi:MAG: DUF3558 domain-containing protein [Kutzneria sp.]|nr:DUF3558 domain-containing protein [Kutzneria sp.]